VNDLLVWVDCEMTGLDLEKDVLIEVAALVTDPEPEPRGVEAQAIDVGRDLLRRKPMQRQDTDAEVHRRCRCREVGQRLQTVGVRLVIGPKRVVSELDARGSEFAGYFRCKSDVDAECVSHRQT
jgi:hypothetical protein